MPSPEPCAPGSPTPHSDLECKVSCLEITFNSNDEAWHTVTSGSEESGETLFPVTRTSQANFLTQLELKKQKVPCQRQSMDHSG
uniref:Ring finger protein 144B n=1 Tax=Molossus molossus TaxID=27622 RepID=A0A7J8FB69_MOLMO|nr:ring finger protein 144B [Molossus molossus]